MTVSTKGSPTPASHEGEARTARAVSLGRTFVRGFVRPSLAGCVGTLVLAFGQLAWLATVVDPAFVAGLHPTTLMSDPLDYDAYVTVVAQRFRESGGGRPAVIYTGNSAAVEALDDPSTVAPALTEALSTPVEFHFFATLGQTLWETCILVDELPGGFRGAVVIGVSPRAVTMSNARLQTLLSAPRLALSSPAFLDEVTRSGLEPPRRTGIYLLDFGPFFVARRLAFVRRPFGLLRLDTHHYTKTRRGWTEDDWRRKGPEIPDQVDLSRMPEFVALLERLLGRLLSREAMRVVLLEAPQHPRMTDGLGEKGLLYREAMELLAALPRVEYWRLDDEAGLTGEDFHDWGHLGRVEARERFQKVLTRRLAEVLRDVLRDRAVEAVPKVPEGNDK